MDFLVVLFCLSALVWSVPLVRSGRPIYLAILLLGVSTVFGPLFFAIEGAIQFSLDRLLWVVMLGLVAVQWRLGNLAKPTMSRIDWLILAIVGYMFISCQRGGQPPTGSSPTARWLFYVLMPLGSYWVVRLSKLQVNDVRWLKRLILGLGAYLSATAVFEVAGLHGLVFPKYIVDPERWEFFGRGRGPLMNPIGNGMVITLSMIVAILEFMSAGRRGKVGYAMLTMLMLCGGYATLTRSVWVGMAAALGVISLIHLPRWVRVLGFAGAIVFGGAMMMGLKEQLMSIKRDKALSASDAAKSVELRPLLAVVAWEMFKAKPVIGHGFGHYFEHNSPYHDIRSYNLPLPEVRSYAQHNTFLMMLVDTGALGLFAFVSWLAMLFGVGWQLANKRQLAREGQQVGVVLLGGITAYFCNGMFHDLVVIPMVQMFLLTIGGFAVTIYCRGFATVPSPRLASPEHGYSMPAASMNRSC